MTFVFFYYIRQELRIDEWQGWSRWVSECFLLGILKYLVDSIGKDRIEIRERKLRTIRRTMRTYPDIS